MTPEDRDMIRAETAMRVMAALATHCILPPDALPQGHPDSEAIKRRENLARMKRALYAANEADALIAELELREEFDAADEPTIREIVARGIAAGGKILSCKHGRTSYEDCDKCDAEDAAGKSGEKGEKPSEPA